MIFEQSSDVLKNAPQIILDISTDSDLIQNSFLEHNIYSLSTVYTSISFDSLNKFLKIKDSESLVFKLIIEERIRAKIDEDKKLLLFTKEDNSLKFDKQVKSFCNRLIAINNEFTK